MRMKEDAMRNGQTNVGYRLIQFFEYRLGSIVERNHPVECAALGCSRAVGIHPVHTFGGKERHQRLGKLFYGFIESFRRRVPVFAQSFVLSQKQTLDGTHQRTAFAGQVGSGFALESGFEQVSRTDTDTHSDDTVPSLTGSILIDSI